MMGHVGHVAWMQAHRVEVVGYTMQEKYDVGISGADEVLEAIEQGRKQSDLLGNRLA